MATRCIIAEPCGDGWRGRYSHWDGYPSVKLPQIVALVKRDGIETVRKVLLHDNYSWSSINPERTSERDDGRIFSPWNVVAGYGDAHDDASGIPDFFTQSDTEFAWAEFLYILGDASVLVFRAIGSSPTTWGFIGEHRYDSELTDDVIATFSASNTLA